MNRGLLLAFFLFCGPSALAEVLLNEVMFAPGDGNEWIELYNPTNYSIDLNVWNLSDNLQTDSIVCCTFQPNCSLTIPAENYALIADQDTNLTVDDVRLFCVDDNSIGNGLGNSEDEIMIFNGSYGDQMFYSEEEKDNRTLERNAEGAWGKSLVEGGTPGQINSVYNLSAKYENLIISEVLPDPLYEDDKKKPEGEWVELYNLGEKPIELTGLVITDKDDANELIISDDKIMGSSIISPGEYVVVYRDGDADFSLNNYGYEEVRLFVGDELIDWMSYSSTNAGKSWSNIEGNWYETRPTPSRTNEIEEDCDWVLQLDINNSIYRSENFTFVLFLTPYLGAPGAFTVKGEITDIQGKVVRAYEPWINFSVSTNAIKYYTPNLPKGVYQVTFWIEEMECNDDDMTDNQVSRLIAINPTYEKFDSALEIERVYLGNDNKAKWGDQFTAKINIYKGNETTQSVQLWAEKSGEKVSTTTKVNVVDEYTNYPLTLPVQLEANCDEKIKSGKVLLILEAFGLKVEKELEVEGVNDNVCRDYLDYVKDFEEKSALHYDIIDLPSSIEPGGIIRFKVQLTGDDKMHDYRVWGYAYRGNKCYSCKGQEKDSNLQRFILLQNEVKMVEFLLKFDEDMDEGEYKIKVKLNKDGQKTDQELTRTIYVSSPQISVQEQALAVSTVLSGDSLDEPSSTSSRLSSQKKKVLNQVTGVVVYESSFSKAKKLAVYFLVAAFALLSLILLWKRK